PTFSGARSERNSAISTGSASVLSSARSNSESCASTVATRAATAPFRTMRSQCLTTCRLVSTYPSRLMKKPVPLLRNILTGAADADASRHRERVMTAARLNPRWETLRRIAFFLVRVLQPGVRHREQRARRRHGLGIAEIRAAHEQDRHAAVTRA